MKQRILVCSFSRTFALPSRECQSEGAIKLGHPHLNPLPSRERKLDHFTSSDGLVTFSTFLGLRRARADTKPREKEYRIGVKMNKKSVVAILVFLCTVLPSWSSAAERKSDLRVSYNSPHISVEARGVRLRELLRDVSQKVGFELTDYGIPDRDLTISIQEVTVEELLRQLLRGENYGVVYQEKDRAISKVLLLSSPVYAQAPVSENQQTRTESDHRQEGLTVVSAAPPYQPARPERKRETSAESEPRVEDILRVHAIPGATGSGTFPQSLTLNAPQPPRNSTPAFPPTGAASESLAMTTRLAQENLKALADGLATATQSLLNVPAKK